MVKNSEQKMDACTGEHALLTCSETKEVSLFQVCVKLMNNTGALGSSLRSFFFLSCSSLGVSDVKVIHLQVPRKPRELKMVLKKCNLAEVDRVNKDPPAPEQEKFRCHPDASQKKITKVWQSE